LKKRIEKPSLLSNTLLSLFKERRVSSLLGTLPKLQEVSLKFLKKITNMRDFCAKT
jgi:hypothetical protein